MTTNDDWFRSGDWDESAREQFEAKLERARKAGRSQYLRIKGLGLLNAGHVDAAHTLFVRVLVEYADDWGQVRSTKEHLADLALRVGRTDEAVALYLQVLDSQGRPRLSCTSGAAHMSLAQIYVDRGEYQSALEALNDVPVSELGMNDLIFRWNCLLAEISLGVGDQDASVAAARRALALLDAPDQFSRHPGVGRAAADASVVQRLRQLELGAQATAERHRFKRSR